VKNRWFLTVAGSVDTHRCSGVLRASSATAPHAAVRGDVRGSRDRRRDHLAVRFVVRSHSCRGRRAACRLPVLAGCPGIFLSWWPGVPRLPLILVALAGVALLVMATIALPREIGGTDPAAQANWWSDYAEHATILAVAGVLAASRGPGWRILRYTCAAVWLYLGFVATFVLPHHNRIMLISRSADVTNTDCLVAARMCRSIRPGRRAG
jgi:hypothetical protein